MNTLKSLWGDLSQTETLRTPFIILKEQAAVLAQQTKGLLTGDVRRDQSVDGVLLRLQILAPSLGGYRYTVIEATHGTSVYPLSITTSAIQDFQIKKCESEAEFEQALEEILSSPEVRKVISALLSDIRADSSG